MLARDLQDATKRMDDQQKQIISLTARVDTLSEKSSDGETAVPATVRTAAPDKRRGSQGEERHVSITTFVEGPRLDLKPTDDEHNKLLNVVFLKFPNIKPDERRAAEFWADYKRFFEVLGCAGRAEKPDGGKYLSWWIDEFRSLLGGYVRGNAFLAAALAQGDLSYVAGNGANISWELGLVVGGGGRRPSGEAWRKVIETGELLRPTLRVSA